jgi:hypothetical protein
MTTNNQHLHMLATVSYQERGETCYGHIVAIIHELTGPLYVVKPITQPENQRVHWLRAFPDHQLTRMPRNKLPAVRVDYVTPLCSNSHPLTLCAMINSYYIDNVPQGAVVCRRDVWECQSCGAISTIDVNEVWEIEP